MLLDSHTHIHFPVYDSDREAVIQRAQNNGVKMLCVGTQSATSESAIELAEKYPEDVWATVGFHPNHLSYAWHYDKKEQREAVPENFDIEKLRNLARHPKVVAIGECGLDYYRLDTRDEKLEMRVKEKQQEVFLKQAELAKELNKALMIHCRSSKNSDDAYFDILEILKNKSLLSRVIAVMHFYVGGLKVTKQLIDAGFYFTFGGVITFAREYDEVIKYIPLDRILLETDAPYVAPEPYRGKRNEPSYITETAKKLAELKGVDFEKISEQTTANALQVFGVHL
jgi:TatD DNase family protein